MRKLGLAVIATIAVAAPAFAIVPVESVPEIDAGAGTAAVAALGAGVALLWERRRRRR